MISAVERVKRDTKKTKNIVLAFDHVSRLKKSGGRSIRLTIPSVVKNPSQESKLTPLANGATKKYWGKLRAVNAVTTEAIRLAFRASSLNEVTSPLPKKD